MGNIVWRQILIYDEDMLKKPALALMALALCSVARAADLSKNVWSFIAGSSRQQPMMQSNRNGQAVKMWMEPEGLQTAMGLFVYAPKYSTNHWIFMLMGAQLPAADYFGTARWTAAETIRDAKDPGFILHFNRLVGGMYNGLYMADDVVQSKGDQMRMVMLLTPQMFELMKKNRDLGSSVQH